MAYEFHYTPTGTGAISGTEVLEQTEDAINDLGNTAISGVQEALDKAEQAFTNSANAVDDAQTALNTANNAEGVAIQAQNDVNNLSGTVTNIGNRVTTAEGNITNLQGRMTTAEGNVTNLQGRMTTAEGNIGNLQTAVSTAQATANSAQQTANTARQQSYVLRHSSSSVTDNSTIAYSTLDNTDNVKSGDKVIDINGKIFSVVSVDTANSTVTVGSALIDLALDGNVVHTSGAETVAGIKTFSDDTYVKSLNFTNEVSSTSSSSSAIMPIITTVTYTDQTASKSARINLRITAIGDKSLYPHENSQYALGLTSRKWSEVHAMTYYYGSSDVEFSTKFVTTDTTQEISSNKTFTGTQYYKDNNVQYFGIDFSKGTAPSAYTARCTYFSPLTGGGSTYQTSNGLVGCAVNNDNVVTTFMHAIKNTAGTTTRTSFVLYYDTDNDKRSVTTNGDFLPILTGQGIGNSTSKWATINGLEPSALGMPDLANGIDISSYIDVSQTSEYTTSSNGYISICGSGSASATNAIVIKDKNYNFAVSTRSMLISSNQLSYVTIPVLANHTYEITCGGVTTIDWAYFYPCLGNV